MQLLMESVGFFYMGYQKFNSMKKFNFAKNILFLYSSVRDWIRQVIWLKFSKTFVTFMLEYLNK